MGGGAQALCQRGGAAVSTDGASLAHPPAAHLVLRSSVPNRLQSSTLVHGLRVGDPCSRKIVPGLLASCVVGG